MKSLKELKAVAEKKGLRFEINKIPALNRIDIGIEYRSNIWAWWYVFTTDTENFDENEQLLFRETYNCVCGRQDKTFERGWKVERQLFGEV